MSRCKVVTAARRYLGTPYHHQGRVKPSEGNLGGLDCLGLVLAVGSDLGHKFPDFAEYEMQVLDGRLEAGLNQYLTRIYRPLLGCVMLLRVEKVAQHVAIRTDKGLIHSIARRAVGDPGSVVETSFDERWKSRLVACFDYPAVIEDEAMGGMSLEEAKEALLNGGCGCADGHRLRR